MSEPIIELKNVTKRFGDLTVLREMSLSVPRGQKVALIGPSGSGKSTLLRVIMTLEQIGSGELRVAGQSVRYDEASLRATRRHVGMVFQHFNLFPHMSVLRNVTEAPVHVLGLSLEEAQSRAMELLDQVGLKEKADAKPAQLSGGQKQRVAIARALAMRPDILLFDEITSALDPELVGEVLGVLRDLGRKTDITMLTATHEMDFAKDFADRVLFLEGGRILEDAPPEKIFTDPDNERTREFLHRVLGA